MRIILAISLVLWASVANADFMAGVLQQQAQQTSAPTTPAYKNQGTLSDLGVTATSPVAVDMPDALENNALLLAFVYTATSTGPTMTETGWTRHPVVVHANPFTFTVFSHPITSAGSEPTSVDISFSSTAFKAVIVQITNASSVDDIQCAITPSFDFVTSHPLPDVTPTETVGLILSAIAFRQGTGEFTITTPAEIIISSGGDSARQGLAARWQAQSGTSAQGAATFTTSITRMSAGCTLAVS